MSRNPNKYIRCCDYLMNCRDTALAVLDLDVNISHLALTCCSQMFIEVLNTLHSYIKY